MNAFNHTRNFAIRILGPLDADVLTRVDPDVLDRPARPELVEEFLHDPRHHIAVAIHDKGIVVGMASGLHYIHPDKPVQFFINEVGVADGRQNQGVGQRLVEQLLVLARRLGCSETWVATEEEDAPARALYRKTGGEEAPESIVMYTYRFDPP